MKLISTLFLALTLVLSVSISDADAKRRPRVTTTTTTTTTVPAVVTPVVTLAEVVNEYCTTYCQPADWTLVANTTCDYVKSVCLEDDGTGQPNCEWYSRSCD